MGRRFLPRPICLLCGKTCKDLYRTYCSRECQHIADRGKPRPDMIGNQWAFRGDAACQSAFYYRMRQMAPPGPCIDCGSTEQIVTHHIDHNPRNNVPENLVRMCRACHARHHGKIHNNLEGWRTKC